MSANLLSSFVPLEHPDDSRLTQPWLVVGTRVDEELVRHASLDERVRQAQCAVVKGITRAGLEVNVLGALLVHRREPVRVVCDSERAQSALNAAPGTEQVRSAQEDLDARVSAERDSIDRR